MFIITSIIICFTFYWFVILTAQLCSRFLAALLENEDSDFSEAEKRAMKQFSEMSPEQIELMYKKIRQTQKFQRQSDEVKAFLVAMEEYNGEK